jgi:hypothetical protein
VPDAPDIQQDVRISGALNALFEVEEIESIAWELGMDDENVTSGKTKLAKAIALTRAARLRGLRLSLVAIIKRERTNAEL